MDLDLWSGSSKDLSIDLEVIDRSRTSTNSNACSGVSNGSESSDLSDHYPEVINVNGSSKLSDNYPEVTSGRSEHSDNYPQVIDGSGSSNHSASQQDIIEGSNDFEIFPGFSYEVGSRNSFEVSSLVTHGTSNEHIKFHSEAIDRSNVGKHLRQHSDPTIGEGDIIFQSKTLKSSDSSSPASSSEDDLHVNSFVLKSSTLSKSPPESTVGTQSGREDIDHVSIGSLSSSGESDNESLYPRLAPSVSGATLESIGPDFSPTQSPSIQMMNRSQGDESYRIPSSVFQRSKSTSPVDWSLASNDSLFSLQIGNQSFARDNVSAISELSRSGEIPKSCELFTFSVTPPAPLVDSNSSTAGMKYGKGVEPPDKPMKNSEGVTFDDKSEVKTPPSVLTWDSSISKLSDESPSSKYSFSIPKKKKCAWSWLWSWCYFSNCRWGFRYCWNCNKKRWCCHSSPTLEEALTASDIKRQHVEQNMPSASKATSHRCFRCFPSCPHCCSLNCCSSRCCSLNCCSSRFCSYSCCSFRRCCC